MSERLISRRLLLLLTAFALVLVMTLAAVLGFAAVLAAMGDEEGGAVLRWIAGAVTVVFVVDLLSLLLALALHTIERPDEPTEES